MNLSSRVGVAVVFLSCVAGARLGAEVPPGASPTPAAPAPAPAVADTPAPAATPIDPAKEAEIRKMLELTGSVKMADQMVGMMMDALRKHSPDLPEDVWDKVQKEIAPANLLDKLVPVYDKYYTLEELKAINAFFQSPAGQHMMQVQPEVVKENVAIGKEWADEQGKKALLEIDGYKQKVSAPAASTSSAPAPSPAPAPTKP